MELFQDMPLDVQRELPPFTATFFANGASFTIVICEWQRKSNRVLDNPSQISDYAWRKAMVNAAQAEKRKSSTLYIQAPSDLSPLIKHSKILRRKREILKRGTRLVRQTAYIEPPPLPLQTLKRRNSYMMIR